VTQARIGIPLEVWAPERGVYRDVRAAHAALLQLQMMAKRRIPLIGSVWEGPLWMVGGTRETGGKVLPRERYADCIEAIAQFLLTARDKYQAPVDYFSFNEPDLGINFKFSSAQMAQFIALAGPRFRELGLKTLFLVGDTANGSNCADYSRPLLENRAIAPFLGPIAFHSWDALGASESKYREIAALGKQYNKEIWCTEAGHDAQLWQQENPWPSWDNALRLALAYERTIQLSGAHVMDYWTYQDNYRLVSPDGKTPYPAWKVLRQMERALAKGNRVVATSSSNADLKTIAARGPKAGQWSLVLINPQGAGEITVSGLPKNAIYSSFTNSKTGTGFISKPRFTSAQGQLRFSMPARSMLTILSGSVSGS
jgi:O-glycosyl hydrolase